LASYVVLVVSAVVLRRAQDVARLSPDAIAAVLACLATTTFWIYPNVNEGNSRAWAYVIPALALPWLLVMAATYFGLSNGRRSTRNAGLSPRLLVLRTFGHARRSDRLLRGVSGLWLEIGPVDLVVGPDLAASVATLDKLVAWLVGRLRQTFIANVEDVARSISGGAARPYRDGRYAVGEFACLETGWRDAVTELARRARAVVMDLRSFTPDNTGCVFEIGTIVETGIADRTVFLVDGSTDVASLHDVLEDAWERSTSAIGGGQAPPLYEIRSDDDSQFRAVVGVALAQAGKG